MLGILVYYLFIISLCLFIAAIHQYVKEVKTTEMYRKQWIKLKEWEFEQALKDEEMAEWQASSGEDMLWN